MFFYERNCTMEESKKFEVFKQRMVEENEQTYGAEIREKYGNESVDAAAEIMRNMTQDQYYEWIGLDAEILRRLEAAVIAGLLPEDPESKDIAQMHRRWLELSGAPVNAATHRSIVELYVMDERFAAYYDRNMTGCAQFLRDAVHCWVK